MAETRERKKKIKDTRSIVKEKRKKVVYLTAVTALFICA
jgi:hypothetical protein